MLRRILFGLTVVAVLVFAGVSLVSFIDKQGKQKVIITSYPDEVSISIGGSEPVKNTEFYLEPGTYTATVSRDGFSTAAVRIDTSTASRYPVLVSLLAESDEALTWEEDNIPKRQAFEVLSSDILNQQGSDAREEEPIIQYLPAKSSLYSIGYISNDDGSITVTIHAPDVYVPYALNHIKRWGLDPVDYDIEFVNQRNIFEDE